MFLAWNWVYELVGLLKDFISLYERWFFFSSSLYFNPCFRNAWKLEKEKEQYINVIFAPSIFLLKGIIYKHFCYFFIVLHPKPFGLWSIINLSFTSLLSMLLGINASTSQSFLNYLLLALTYGSFMIYRRKPLKVSSTSFNELLCYWLITDWLCLLFWCLQILTNQCVFSLIPEDVWDV